MRNIMNPEPLEDTIKFLKDNIDSLEDNAYGLGYRASAYLLDGTYLPCVIFRNSKTVIDLAISRFKKEQTTNNIFQRFANRKYRDAVKTFVASGNCVNHYDIGKVEKSRFAFPISIQNQIKGETSMSWTAFVAKFKDGRHLSFGTTWNWEFFDLPENYLVDDIVEIINHSYITKSGEIVGHGSIDRTTQWDKLETIHRPRQFFECYIDNL